MLSWAIQVFLIGITDSHPALQYGQLILALVSLNACSHSNKYVN